MRTLRGKRAIITGAASGIGRAIAMRLAMKGAHVCLVDSDQRKLDETRREVAALGVDVWSNICDVSQPEQIDTCVDKVLSRWQFIDVLVNNAGICYYGTTELTPQEIWDNVLAVNLHAPIRFTKRFLPVLIQRPEAHVLNVASMYGLFATNRSAAYHVSKFGLVGFSEAFRAECGRTGIGVTALCPGFVDTGLFTALADESQMRFRTPPKWVCTTPDRVARKAIRAIYRDQGTVLVTPLAHVAYLVKRVSPGLLDRIYRIGRARKIRDKLKAFAENQGDVAQSNPPDRIAKAA